jgi:Ca2+-binding RTX toxin-like protein
MRRIAVTLTLAAVALAAPAVANAAVVVSIQSGTLTIVGTPDDDDISIAPKGSNALGPTTEVGASGQDIEAGAGCQGFGDPSGPANDNSVHCPTNDYQGLSVTLGDGDDEIDTGGSLPVAADGGPGDDEITTGRGPDVVQGGPGDDLLDLDQNTSSGTTSAVDGGLDDDEIRIGRDGRATDVSGGAGTDTATYRLASGGRTASLDGQPNDGGTNEGDNVRSDVEILVGSGFDDTLVGSDGPNTLDGAAGTDRLEGLGGADTLIGGPGTNDATFGGEGDDAIMLRDGLVDACPSGGPGANTFDLDLVDQGTFIVARFFFPRCIFISTRFPQLTGVVFGAVREGPNVRMSVPPPAVRAAGVRVRLACPAALRRPCAGSLRAFTARGRRVLGSTAYSVRPGGATIAVVPLDDEARTAALAAPALRIVSVETGRLGDKTTIRFTPPRG